MSPSSAKLPEDAWRLQDAMVVTWPPLLALVVGQLRIGLKGTSMLSGMSEFTPDTKDSDEGALNITASACPCYRTKLPEGSLFVPHDYLCRLIITNSHAKLM